MDWRVKAIARGDSPDWSDALMTAIITGPDDNPSPEWVANLLHGHEVPRALLELLLTGVPAWAVSVIGEHHGSLSPEAIARLMQWSETSMLPAEDIIHLLRHPDLPDAVVEAVMRGAPGWATSLIRDHRQELAPSLLSQLVDSRRQEWVPSGELIVAIMKRSTVPPAIKEMFFVGRPPWVRDVFREVGEHMTDPMLSHLYDHATKMDLSKWVIAVTREFVDDEARCIALLNYAKGVILMVRY